MRIKETINKLEFYEGPLRFINPYEVSFKKYNYHNYNQN
jgi:hypothetical protein